jgi:two-component system catabolic regulation response regulator CreB
MRPRILIIEDEPAIADTIQYALETDGFETRTVSSGLPALPLLSETRFDLIILDIGLPDVSGLELCKTLREKHTLPIIFLTARADEVDRVVGLEIGADDYVVKPFSPRELSARVKAILRRTSNPHPSPQVSSAFRIDPDRRQILYFSRPLELSKYEFNLLGAFVRRPGQVFSRDQLMNLAWEDPDASMDRTIDAHIKNIRAKLKAIAPETDPIITHRGVGYSLKEGL